MITNEVIFGVSLLLFMLASWEFCSYMFKKNNHSVEASKHSKELKLPTVNKNKKYHYEKVG